MIISNKYRDNPLKIRLVGSVIFHLQINKNDARAGKVGIILSGRKSESTILLIVKLGMSSSVNSLKKCFNRVLGIKWFIFVFFKRSLKLALRNPRLDFKVSMASFNYSLSMLELLERQKS